jgi:hypothetical protein
MPKSLTWLDAPLAPMELHLALLPDQIRINRAQVAVENLLSSFMIALWSHVAQPPNRTALITSWLIGSNQSAKMLTIPAR